MRIEYDGFTLVLDAKRATVRMLGQPTAPSQSLPIVSEKVGVEAVMQFLLLHRQMMEPPTLIANMSEADKAFLAAGPRKG